MNCLLVMPGSVDPYIHNFSYGEWTDPLWNDPRIIGQRRLSFHFSVLQSVYIKTQNPVRFLAEPLQVNNCEQVLIGRSWGP